MLNNVSRNDSITSKDWEPLYQRLSSCLSSNESGYDSDGGATGARLGNNLSISGGDTESIASGTLKRNSLISLSSSEGVGMGMGLSLGLGAPSTRNSSICSAPVSLGGYNYDYETETIRRRFRQVKLERKCQEDCIGIVLSPKTVMTNSNEQQYRYLIVELEPYGMAQNIDEMSTHRHRMNCDQQTQSTDSLSRMQSLQLRQERILGRNTEQEPEDHGEDR
ncbi:GM26737 [Drosophila sechellia]|uniref:GM26737 n=1 Tax=Drosophila sechellia TaxID=7238 RepID=B4IQ38_DROSE|nr:GM26737 [Drosophila sechellia]